MKESSPFSSSSLFLPLLHELLGKKEKGKKEMCCSSVVAKKLGCRLKIKLRRLKEGVKCALLIHHRPKIQPVIATYSAGEFYQQPALNDNTDN